MAVLANTLPFSARGRDGVYVATLPLRASKGPAQLFFSTAYSLHFWDLQHFMVIIKPSSPPHPHQLATVYDFQPEDPENIWVAAAALFRTKVAGVVRVRKLEKLPKRKCWYVGHAKGNATEAVQRFNRSWETNLVLGSHDCRDYAQGLVEYLTGKKAVLEHLRAGKGVSEL